MTAAVVTLGPFVACVAYTVFVWWFSTGAILWLDRLPRRTYPWSLAAATLVAAAAAVGLRASLDQPTQGGAVLAFTCALGLWGWHEMSFLMGFVTGPRQAPCPRDASPWRRFRMAAATLAFHEIALAATAAILAAVSWGSANPLGAWTFGILLVSRLSAKLNLFFGVPNFSDAFFPEHLRYLSSYLRKRAGNGLFPVSIAVLSALSGAAAWRALEPLTGAFEATAFSLAFALTALALIEHAFMALPIADTALWRWAMPTAAVQPPLSGTDV